MKDQVLSAAMPVYFLDLKRFFVFLKREYVLLSFIKVVFLERHNKILRSLTERDILMH